MTELQRIQDQLHRAFYGPAWHGPSLSEILKDVTAQQAAWKPEGGSHCIWELVLHVAAWEGVVCRRISVPGQPLPKSQEIEVNSEQDWAGIGALSLERWAATFDALRAGNSALSEAIARFPEKELDSIVPGADYSYYVLLHGAVQHDLYHAGQMAMLKRLATAHLNS